MPPSISSMIDHIIDVALGVVPQGPTNRENREATRVPYNGHVSLIRFTPTGKRTEPLLLESENISSGGLCVRLPEELPVGCRGVVMLSRSDGERVILLAKVVYCNARDAFSYECGLEFEPPSVAVSFEDFKDGQGNMPEVGLSRAA
ncbi:MAG: PilZ domain-containing protein [Gemmatimonadales bacterium]